MKTRNPISTNEGARQMIWFGVPTCVFGMLVWLDRSFQHKASDMVWCYILLGEAAIVIVLGLIAYKRIPKLFILPIGIVGWIVSFLILFYMVNE
jgi:hypothetical protein